MSRHRVVLTPVVLLLGAALGGCDSAVESGTSDSCADREVTITGTDGDDRLRGTPGRDVISGGGGDDRILGLGGDDVLCGGPGADLLDGGAGDDMVDGGADRRDAVDTESYEWVGDTLVGGRGDDVLVTGDTGSHGPVDVLSYADSPRPVRVDLRTARATGDGTDRIEGQLGTLLGTRGADVLLGSDRGEQINGGLGADRIDGRGGDDRLDAAGVPEEETRPGEGLDRSGDVLLGGSGDDELQDSAGDDRLEGGAGDDLVAGTGGRDRLLGGPGDDSMSDSWPAPGDGGGVELLDGGPGRDRLDLSFLLRPASPDDRPYDPPIFRDAVGTVDLAAGTVVADAGRVAFRVDARGFEDLNAPYGTWTVLGTDGANEILAGDEKRPVVIRARGGDDRLAGSFVDDLLDGGPGRDTGLGYTGDDRFVSIETRIR